MKLPTLTEKAFTAQVIQLAQLQGWIVAHFRPARTAQGWRTACQGDGKGFPDLVLVKRVVLFVELKVGRNQLSPEQRTWRDRLRRANATWLEWRPEDWPEIERILG